MTGEQILSDREIFQSAVALPADERAAYLDRACGDNVELRREVESLLSAHDPADSFMAQPAIGPSAEANELTAGFQPLAERAGTVIGPYKLLQQIGEGGMGVVFMAEQSHPVHRIVALKIIKPGMDTRQVIARFEAERQALAMMDHPNIAKVLDAGTTGEGVRFQVSGVSEDSAASALTPDTQHLTPNVGRPYFVMDLVKGVPITDYSDQQHLTIHQRLELFLPVCHAVQHAHQKGIIHRDIKPNNILVAQYDDRAVSKVIDFGVAKATAQRLTERTMFTQYGQIVGTVEYMSPEQAKFNQLDVDTRSDIYSLGVLLYELLTGETPFDRKRLHSAAFDEVLRIIREEEPPRPSTRLTTLAQQAASTIVSHRGSDIRRLSILVRGELDWIVMKCLEKDRNRRYETASGLARDIQRYLDEQPVEACPPSRSYRLRKFVRRNKGPVFALTALALTLVAGIAGTTIGLIRARLAEDDVQHEAARARLAESRERQRFEQAEAEAEKAKAVTDLIREMLVSADPWAGKGRDYTVRQLLDDFSARLDRQLQYQPELEAEIRALIGGSYGSLGLPRKAEPHLKIALQLRRKVLGESHAKVAQSLLQCAWNANAKNDFAEAEAFTRSALAIFRKQDDPHSLIDTLSSLHNFLNQQRKYQEADATGAEALELAQRGGPEQDAAISQILLNSAASQLGLGRHAEAEKLAREALDLSIQVRGHDHPINVAFFDYLWLALQARGKYDEAEAAGRSALALMRKHYGPRHALSAGMLLRLGLLLEAKHDYSGAEAVYLEALPIALERAAEEPAEATHRSLVNDIRRGLAGVYSKQELRDKAVEVWSRVIESDPADAEAWYWRAELHRRWLREWDLAIADYVKALELDPSRADARGGLAKALVARPEPERREPQRAIQLATEALDRMPGEGYYWNTLAQAYYRAGRYPDAIEALRESLTYRPDDDGLDYIFLAMTHWQLGEKEQARRYYDQGSQWNEQEQPKTEEFRRFQTEAEELMGINRGKPVTTETTTTY